MTPTQLKSALLTNQKANNGAVVLPDPAITSAELQWVIDEVVKESDLKVTDPQISASGKTVTLSGDLSLFGATVAVTIKFSVANAIGATVTVTAKNVHLSDLVGHYLPSADIPSITADALTLTATPKDETFSVTATLSDWTIDAGSPNVAVQSGTLTLGYADSKATATISGTVTVGSASFPVSYTMPGDFSVEGKIPTIDLTGLVTNLTQVTVPSPMPSVTLKNAEFEVEKDGSDYSIGASAQVTSWGETAVEIVHKDSAWQFAAGFALTRQWDLSDIDSSFAFFDDLVFKDAAVVVSTFDDGTFALPHVTLDGGVKKGVTFQGDLALASGNNTLVKNLGNILTLQTIHVDGLFTSPVTNSYIDASLDATASIRNVTLKDPGLKLLFTPAIQLHGTVEIPVKDSSVSVEGILGISDTQATLSVVETGTLPNPGGFQGVTLQEVAVQLGLTFADGNASLGLQGQFKLKKVATPYDFAFEFEVGETLFNPKLLSATIPSLDLPDLFDSVMDATVTLPAALSDLSFTDILIYWCDLPGTTLPNGAPATVGFAFHAAMDAWGWNAQGGITMDFGSGFSGDLSMDPVHIGNGAFDLTGNSPSGGPTLSFDTTKETLDVSVHAQVMGIDQTNVDAKLSSSSLALTLTENVPSFLGASLDVAMTSPLDFSFASSVSLHLDFHTGQLTAPGGISLGALHVDGGFTGHLAVAMKNGAFTLTVDGKLSWQGDHWTMPTITMNTITHDLSKLGGLIESQFIHHAESIFSDLLTDVDEYLELVADGAVTGGAGLITILTKVYGLTIGDVIKKLEAFHIHASGTIHADAGHHLDTPQGFHTDTHAPPHIDHHPHVDEGSSWHHLDVGHHVDTPSGPHADTHVPPHVDRDPHVDTSKHVDVSPRPAVRPSPAPFPRR